MEFNLKTLFGFFLAAEIERVKASVDHTDKLSDFDKQIIDMAEPLLLGMAQQHFGLSLPSQQAAALQGPMGDNPANG